MISCGRLDLFVDYLAIVADGAEVFAITIDSIVAEAQMQYLVGPQPRNMKKFGDF